MSSTSPANDRMGFRFCMQTVCEECPHYGTTIFTHICMGTHLPTELQICYGSKLEVLRFEEYVYGRSPRFAEDEVEQLNPKR